MMRVIMRRSIAESPSSAKFAFVAAVDTTGGRSRIRLVQLPRRGHMTVYPIFQPIIEYPDSDGQPMAETDFQRIPLMYAVEALDLFFEHQPDTYVSGNIFLYYAEGDPTQVISPDVLVAFGIGRGKRRT